MYLALGQVDVDLKMGLCELAEVFEHLLYLSPSPHKLHPLPIQLRVLEVFSDLVFT